MEIIPVKYAKSVLPENCIFENGNPAISDPIVFLIYLIKTEDKMILVDAGCETMPGFVMEDFIGPIKALERISVIPQDITDVIITHAHHDHIESVSYFKNACIYIQKDEYEAGKNYFTPDLLVYTFEDEQLIADNVKAVKIGGHSKGSCIVEVQKDNDTYIIAGDECYARACLEKNIPTGSSCCKEKSVEFIKKYSDKSKYKVLLCHEE